MLASAAPWGTQSPSSPLLHSSTRHGMCFPPRQHWHPLLHTRSPLSAPLPSTWCSSPRGGSQMLFYTLLLQALRVQLLTCLETQSTAGAPPCHIERMNIDAERMNVTVPALTESVLAALALGNLPPVSCHSLLVKGIQGVRGGAGFFSCLAFLPPCTKTREGSCTGSLWPPHCPAKLSQHHPLPVLFLLAE